MLRTLFIWELKCESKKKMKPDIITIIGKSNSGKTTLIEQLISRLSQKGYKIGSVKHTHSRFEIDKEGKDSWRHKHAGAHATLIVSDSKVALVKDDDTSELEKIQAYLQEMDLILAEGFKSLNLPKIEVFREAGGYPDPIAAGDKNLMAFVTDTSIDPGAPVFKLNDYDAVADFIETTYLKKPDRL